MQLQSDDIDCDHANPGENVKVKLKNANEDVRHHKLSCFLVVRVISVFVKQENRPTTCSFGLHFLQDVMSGFVLCSPDNLCKTSKVFDAQIVIMEHESIICAGYSAVMHIHTSAEEVAIKVRVGRLDWKTLFAPHRRCICHDVCLLLLFRH